MYKFHRAFASVAFTIVGALFAGHANAVPVTYGFTVTMTGPTAGPFDGTVSHGTFSFDSSSIRPGDWSFGPDLFTALDFTFNGIHYDATTAMAVDLGFDASGALTGFMFGNGCDLGGCLLDPYWVGHDLWVIMSDKPGFVYSVDDGTIFWHQWTGDVTISLMTSSTPVPEPAAFGLFAFGTLLVGACVHRRRRAA